MATPSGLGGQWGYVSETTAGQLVTVDKFLPIKSDNVGEKIDRIDSKGLRAGRLITAAWKPGKIEVGGTVETELWNTDVASLLKHMFGAVATATNGAQWDYTYTPADTHGMTFTMQSGRPDIGGTVRPWTFGGCKIKSWTLSAEAGSSDPVMLSLDIGAMTSTNGVSLASASYDSTLEPFVYTEAYVKLAGTTNDLIRSVEIKAETGLTDRPRLGSPYSKQYEQNDFRKFTGSLTMDFPDLTEYNRYLTAAEFAVVLGLSNGTEKLTFTMNARYDGDTPELGGPGLLELKLPFSLVSATSDAAAITAVLTNAEGLTGAA